MDCYLCLSESLKISSAGICVECSQGVCTKPSSRVDHAYHGEQCVCGCRKLVCISDMDDHSKRAHSGSVPTCFPAITMTVSARTVAAALSLPNIQTPEEHDEATKVVNEFLNYIRPGYNILSDFRKDLPREYWETRPLPGKPARMGVFFRDAFFQTTAPKVASVAVRTLGDVFRKMNMVPIVGQLDAGTKSTISHIEEQSILASADHEVVTGAKEIKDATVHLNMLPSQGMIRSLPQLPADLTDEGMAAWLFELDLAELT